MRRSCLTRCAQERVDVYGQRDHAGSAHYGGVPGWSFPVKLLDCPLGKDGEDGDKLEKDLRPFCDELKDKYGLKIVSITTDNCPVILIAGKALAAGIPGCFHVNCGCHVEQLFLKHGLLPLFEKTSSRSGSWSRSS